MKNIKVASLSIPSFKDRTIKEFLDKMSYVALKEDSWGTVDDEVRVGFKIGHNNTNIYLQYDVIEPEMLATYASHNEAICKDSCVEFFIALPNETKYYNFEFNFLGSCLAAYGEERNERVKINPEIIDLITVETTVNRIKEDALTLFNWKIFIEIPIEIFVFSSLKTFNNIQAKANFYKCGDDLIKPHYISWNPIKSDKPDFHLKSYFGTLDFE